MKVSELERVDEGMLTFINITKKDLTVMKMKKIMYK